MHTLHMRSCIIHKSISNIIPFEICEYQVKWLERSDLFLHNTLHAAKTHKQDSFFDFLWLTMIQYTVTKPTRVLPAWICTIVKEAC